MADGGGQSLRTAVLAGRVVGDSAPMADLAAFVATPDPRQHLLAWFGPEWLGSLAGKPQAVAHLRAAIDRDIARLDAPAARCSGYNVVHQPGEPPLDVSARPLLAQRRRWHASLDYSKRLLARMPLRWSEGFHREYDAPDAPPDPHLVLVHLHRADYDLCLARHRASAARPWNPDDLSRGDGAQNRIVQAEAFAEWFRRGPDLDAPAELIPGHFRECL